MRASCRGALETVLDRSEHPKEIGGVDQKGTCDGSVRSFLSTGRTPKDPNVGWAPGSSSPGSSRLSSLTGVMTKPNKSFLFQIPRIFPKSIPFSPQCVPRECPSIFLSDTHVDDGEGGIELISPYPRQSWTLRRFPELPPRLTRFSLAHGQHCARPTTLRSTTAEMFGKPQATCP